MTTDNLRLSTLLPTTAARLYRAWLDSREHAAFTGGAAEVDARVGGRHTAWNGYIEGEILELEPETRIVQTWRTSEFPPLAPASRLEVQLSAEEGGTRLSLVHTGIPAGQGQRYRRGWQDHYFTPMTLYFTTPGGSPQRATKKATKGSPTKKSAATHAAKKPVSASTARTKKSASKKLASLKKSRTGKRPAKPAAAKRRS